MAHNSGTVVLVINDSDLRNRFIAIAAIQGIENPDGWVSQNLWDIVTYDLSEDGMLDAYQYAVETDVHRVKMYGKDPAIVSDAAITEVIQALKNAPPAE